VIDFRDANGRQRRYILPETVTSEQHAHDILAIRSGRAKALRPTAEGRRLKEFVDGYVKWSENHQSKETARDKRSAMKNAVKIIGDVLVNEIGPGDFNTYKNARLADVSPRTVNKEVDYIRAMFNKYLSDELGLVEPLAFKVRRLKAERPIPKVLSTDDVDKFLAALEEESCTLALFLLIYATGLRKNEAVTLRWENVDLTTGRIYIIRKGGKQQAIPVKGWPLEMLMRINGDKTEGWVFPSPHKRGDHIKDLRKAIKRAKERAGIPKERRIYMHLFRHSIATRMVEEGVDFRIIQTMLGHQTVTTTEFYGQVATESLKRHMLEINKAAEINNDENEN